MKVLITGAEGFVGSHIIKGLIPEGHELHGIIFPEGLKVPIQECEYLTPHLIDITDREKTIELMTSLAPDIVVHLAAVSFIPDGDSCTRSMVLTNIYGTHNIISGLKCLSKKCHVIFASSGEVYLHDEKNEVITENSDLGPQSVYAVTKLSSEYLIKGSGLPYTVLRLFNHTGVGQRHDFAIPNFVRQIVMMEKEKKEKYELKVGNLDSYKDFTDIEDIAEAYKAVIAAPSTGTFNICSGRAYKLKDLVNKMIAISPKAIKITIDESRYRAGSGRRFFASNEKFSRLYGWRPKIPIEDTIKKLFDYFRKQE